jgi:hypothetical protein
VRSSCHLVLGGCLAMRGRFDAARIEIDSAASLNVAMGRPFGSAAAARFGAYVESMADDFEAAERRLNPGIDLMRRLADRSWLGSLLAMRAEARARLGDLTAATGDVNEARGLSAEDDTEGQLRWRLAAVTINVRMGNRVEAERLAREAVRLGDESDTINDSADARYALASVVPADHGSERRRLLLEARRLYRRKGNLVGGRRVGAGLMAIDLA